MFNVQSLIDEALQKNSQYKASTRDGAKFHVSDAGGCYRARIYKRMGIEPTREIEIQGLRKMTAGDAGHQKIQSLLKYNGMLYMSETELETEHIKGHPDAVVKNGSLSLLEIKTIEKWGMTYIKKQGAKREHQLQMFTYWTMLRTDLPNLNNAVLSYVKREDFEAKDFYYNWSEDIQRKVDDEWNPLIKHWVDKTLPDCTCNVMYDGAGPKYCRYGIDEINCCDISLWKEVSSQ